MTLMITGCTGHVGFALSNLLKNYYKDYYLINFSEKIRISIITWIFSIFIAIGVAESIVASFIWEHLMIIP